MATKRPDVINHEKAVKFIRSVLQEKLGKVEWETTTSDINSIDIKGQVSKYDKKTPREHVLIRPDTYIGDVEVTSENMWVYNEESNKIVMENINYTPGFLKIFDELEKDFKK